MYCQGKLTAEDYGRDHHPRCFTIWLAGGGVKPGISHGETDDYCYNIIEDAVHVHDLHATIFHCLGIDHTRLTLQIPGTTLPADGCAWRSGYQTSRVSAAPSAILRTSCVFLCPKDAGSSSPHLIIRKGKSGIMLTGKRWPYPMLACCCFMH
mgnify:CR=1 FL=1